MNNSNRRVGNSFERRLCITLAGYGFWAHNLAQDSTGQPFDVMAARNGKAYPIDCKVCTNDIFKMSRIEENQSYAMTLWRETGNGEGWFALELSNGSVYLFTLAEMEEKALLVSVLSASEIRKGLPLRKWVELCG